MRAGAIGPGQLPALSVISAPALRPAADNGPGTSFFDRRDAAQKRDDRRDVLLGHVRKRGELTAVRTLACRDRAAICSSVQLPMSVSLSGVMFRPAKTPGPGIRLAEEVARRVAVVAAGDDDQLFAAIDLRFSPRVRQQRER